LLLLLRRCLELLLLLLHPNNLIITLLQPISELFNCPFKLNLPHIHLMAGYIVTNPHRTTISTARHFLAAVPKEDIFDCEHV
jgi:hypothetical protein